MRRLAVNSSEMVIDMKKKDRILGSIVIRVTSESRERFINMCRFKDIRLYNIVHGEGCIEANMAAKDFKRLREVARKTNSRVRIIKKSGLAFMAFKYRKHYSFAAGIILCFSFLYVCSLFLFNITFSGNVSLTQPVLLRYLDGIGIKNGMKISAIDCDVIETKMRQDFDEITWVSATVKGNHLYVYIKENDGYLNSQDNINSADAVSDKDDSGQITENTGAGYNIVASQNGIVESIITRKGTPQVKKGDEVTAGQILVSGIVEIYDDSGTLTAKKAVNADADIYIRSEIEYSDTLQAVYEKKSFTGRKKTVKTVALGDYIVNIGFEKTGFKNCDTVYNYKNVALKENFYLPIAFGSRTYYEYELIQSEYTEEEAAEILNKNLNSALSEYVENNVQILDNRVRILKNNNAYLCQGTLVLLMPQTEKSSLTQEQTQQPQSGLEGEGEKESS